MGGPPKIVGKLPRMDGENKAKKNLLEWDDLEMEKKNLVCGNTHIRLIERACGFHGVKKLCGEGYGSEGPKHFLL